MIEIYLVGVSVRRVEDIVEALPDMIKKRRAYVFSAFFTASVMAERSTWEVYFRSPAY